MPYKCERCGKTVEKLFAIDDAETTALYTDAVGVPYPQTQRVCIACVKDLIGISDEDLRQREAKARSWTLSPSDFAFLWESCRRCFYLKVVHKIQQPSIKLPSVFTTIDNQMKDCYKGQRTETIAPALPKGTVKYGEKWVQSKPIALEGRASRCIIRGKVDTILEFDDGTFGVIDFKTSLPREEQLLLYSRQLCAYAYALENAEQGQLALSPVTKLGLLVFRPTSFQDHGEGNAYFFGSLDWVDVPRDDVNFMRFLYEVLSVLDQPIPPEPVPSCIWCQYRAATETLGV